MKCLIYQYWNGVMPPGAEYGSCVMADYAERIGADYRLDRNKYYTGTHGRYFDLLRPVYDDAFHTYDRVLFADLDVFPVDGLTANIFDEPVGDLGMCEEPGMPDYRDGRKKHINGAADKRWAALINERWGITVPVDSKGRVRVFNSGVVMYTRDGMRKAAEVFLPIQDYVSAVSGWSLSSFYAIDQNYLHAMVHMAGIDFTEMSVEWNRQVHGKDDGGIYDARTDRTRFVHIQLSGADHKDAATHARIVNGRGIYE